MVEINGPPKRDARVVQLFQKTEAIIDVIGSALLLQTEEIIICEDTGCRPLLT